MASDKQSVFTDNDCEITPEMLDELSNGKGEDEDGVHE